MTTYVFYKYLNQYRIEGNIHMEKENLTNKNIPNVFFHILTKCNLSCRHCYINSKQHGNKILKYETIISWLKIIFKKIKKANIIILGGEPTIHPQLPSIIKKAKNIGYKNVTVDTNGFKIKQLLKNIKKTDVNLFSFSIDGPTPLTNDVIRGKGSFKSCISGIYEAKKKGFKVGLIFTASTANFCYINELIKLLDFINIDILSIQIIGLRGKTIKTNEKKYFLKQIDDISWLKTLPKIARKISNKGIQVNYPKIFLSPKENFKCLGLNFKNYFIFPNGRVYSCPLCEDYPLHGYTFFKNFLVPVNKINEKKLFNLNIIEGCVINKLVQPNNIKHSFDGRIKYKIDCCMSKKNIKI